MFKSFRHSATALLLSVSLAATAIGASASPARADGDEAARIIGGLIALYAIGRVIHESRDNRHSDRPRHQPQRLVAPARCFIEGHDRNGSYRGYLRNCTRNNVARADLLPRNCLRQVHTQRGQRNIYQARCLANNGWVRS